MKRVLRSIARRARAIRDAYRFWRWAGATVDAEIDIARQTFRSQSNR